MTNGHFLYQRKKNRRNICFENRFPGIGYPPLQFELDFVCSTSFVWNVYPAFIAKTVENPVIC